MSVHSRPTPKTATPKEIASNPVTTPLERPEARPAPLPADTRRSEDEPPAERKRASEARVDHETTGVKSQPWYRSESWLAVMLGGFVPIFVAVIAPEAAQYPLIGLSGVLLVIGGVMLIRQGVFRPPTGSEPHRK
jgi:VIT1/CCC1 family predicted Fe2+/Mn2+ transporter